MDHVLKSFPSITTLLYTINTKRNDSLHDLEPVTYYGKGYVIEQLSTGPNGRSFNLKLVLNHFSKLIQSKVNSCTRWQVSLPS